MIWLLLTFGFILFIILYVTLKPFRYWLNKGAPQTSVWELWSNNLKIFFQIIPPAESTLKLHNSFGDERYVGSCHYFSPLLFIRDPDLIKQIAVKDFEHFIDRVQFVRSDVDQLWTRNLFSLRGDRWKEMRATLSPSFTSSKMRGMFSLIKECADNFVKFYNRDDSTTITINSKDTFAKYANDVIASAAFGVTCNSLEDPNNEFYLRGKEATDFSGFWKNIKFVFMAFCPRIARMLGWQMFNTEVREFFRKLVKDNIESREKNGIIRPDMIHLLMEARKGKLKHEDNASEIDTGYAIVEESVVGKEEARQSRQLSNDDITAQALIFFFAGFDSSSSLMCFLAHELAVNPEIQQRLQDEIDATLKQCNGTVTYEALLKMKYLDMVVSETLRKWPNVAALDRICVKPYTIEPVGKDEKPIPINVDDLIWFPLYALHRDPKYYPDPERFDPERFSDENKSSIYPYTYFPFGTGPRSCIGNRFALLETKLLFFTLLAEYNIVVVEKTQIPLQLCRKQFNLAASKGFWVGFRPRKVKAQ